MSLMGTNLEKDSIKGPRKDKIHILVGEHSTLGDLS